MPCLCHSGIRTGRSVRIVWCIDRQGTKSIERQANRKLSLDVRRALAKTNGVEVSGITVLARSGDVTLTGSVPEAPQIEKATEVTKAVPGVRTVINKLTIGAPYGQ